MDSIEQDLKGDEDKPLPHDIIDSLVSLGGAVQVCLDHNRAHQKSRKADLSLEDLGAQ